MQGQLTTAAQVRAFALAGNATLTLVSKRTGARFTYRIQAKHFEGREGTNAARNAANPFRFVNVLTGADNENSYTYLGRIDGDYFPGRKISREAPSAKAFEFFYYHVIERGVFPDTLEVWHEGRCARCARKLTVPSSIASGFGPECIQYAGFVAEAA